MSLHELKLAAEFYDALADGRKAFEVRKDDRGFAVGDTLHLREVDLLLHYTGRALMFRVTYILRGWGIERGYVCMGIAP